MGVSQTLANELLDAIYNADAYSVATPFLSLHDGDPGTTGANEIAGGSYIRQAISMAAAATGAITSDADITFADMPAVGGSGVTHVGVWTANTDGTFLKGGALTSAKIVNAGDSFVVPTGDLDDTFS